MGDLILPPIPMTKEDIRSAVWDSSEVTPPTGSYGERFIGNLDVAVSTRSVHAPANVWEYLPRFLTSKLEARFPVSIRAVHLLDEVTGIYEPFDPIDIDYSIEIKKGRLAISYVSTIWHTTEKKTGLADRHIRFWYYDDNLIAIGRFIDSDNYYGVGYLYTGAATEDFRIFKVVAGTLTYLAVEAVDLSPGWWDIVGSISGINLKASRDGGVTYPLTATDTDITDGGWGWRCWAGDVVAPISWGSPTSVLRKPIAYFEVPIIGDGSEENPFRPKMPEEIVDTVNKQSLPYSALIPIDRATKSPKHGIALVRILEQPDRNTGLRSLSYCLDSLRAMTGVTELTRDEALVRARELDDKLHRFDLIRVPTPTIDQIKEYMDWRKTIFGIEMIEEEIERYLKSDKGW